MCPNGSPSCNSVACAWMHRLDHTRGCCDKSLRDATALLCMAWLQLMYVGCPPGKIPPPIQFGWHCSQLRDSPCRCNVRHSFIERVYTKWMGLRHGQRALTSSPKVSLQFCYTMSSADGSGRCLGHCGVLNGIADGFGSMQA